MFPLRIRFLCISLIVIAEFVSGGCSMVESSNTSDFKWEWPGDRKPESRLLATVKSIEKQDEGLFGINKSPSIADNYPDAQILTGKILGNDSKLAEKTFTLILPKQELGGILPNDKIGLGIVNKYICICISKAPKTENDEKLMEWVSNWDCTKD